MENKHSHSHVDEQQATTNAAGKYYCPMHGEGDKVYDKPGNCPVCGMHLVQEGTPDIKKDKHLKSASNASLKGKYYCLCIAREIRFTTNPAIAQCVECTW